MRRLKKCLEITNERYRTILSTIDQNMIKFWKTTVFHHYTDHGYEHTLRIISQLGTLLEDHPDLLNEHERFIILASAYLHDIGMQSPTHAGLDKKEYTEYTLVEIEQVREVHHISSSLMILDSIRHGSEYSFGLEECKECVTFIADVSKYHSKLDVGELDDTGIEGEVVRLPLLAALLKLGDAVDADFRRVDIDVLKLWDIPVLSKFHWWAHHYVRSVNISRGKIGLFFRFPEEDSCEEVIPEFRRKIEDSINNHFLEVYDVLDKYGVRLYREPTTERVVYEPEGVLDPIPEDLCKYLRSLIREQELVQARTGVLFYLDGVPFSDEEKVAESSSRVLRLLSEEKNEAARVEVEKCLSFALSPWQNLIMLNLAGNVYYILGDLKGALQRYNDSLRICNREDLKNILRNDVEQARVSGLANMGLVYSDLGESRKAIEYYKDALKICREIGYRQGEAGSLGNMGIVYSDLGEPSKAIEYYNDALKIYREAGHRQGEANVLGNMGIMFSDMGEPSKAIEYYNDALKIYREAGHRQGEANVLGNIGVIYSNLGEPSKAIEYYEDALKIHREIGHRKGEANALGNIGTVYRDIGEPNKALKNYKDALKINSEIGFKQGEANNLGNMGNIYRTIGKTSKALKYHEDALKINSEIGFKQGEANNLGNMGLVYSDMGEPNKAIEYFNDSLEINHEIGYKQGEANQLGNIGITYIALGERDKALKHLMTSLKIHREIGYRVGEATSLGNLGIVYSDMGEPNKAIEYFRDSLEINHEIGYKQGEASDLGNLGNINRIMGKPIKAIEYYENALKIYQEVGHKLGEASSLFNIGIAYEEIKEYNKAINHLKDSLTIFKQIKSKQAMQIENILKEIEIKKRNSIV